jgi:hypothetical protein
VLGALQGKTTLPDDYTPTSTNDIRVLRSRSGMEIGFDDKDKVLVVKTVDGNILKMSDTDKSITITDQNGNEIAMSDKGITIKSAADLTLDAASGKIVIKGSTVDVQ